MVVFYTGQTRLFPTLQVIFRRGDEFLASDKDGKLENVNVDLRDRIPRAENPIERTERMGCEDRERVLSFGLLQIWSSNPSTRSSSHQITRLLRPPFVGGKGRKVSH